MLHQMVACDLVGLGNIRRTCDVGPSLVIFFDVFHQKDHHHHHHH